MQFALPCATNETHSLEPANNTSFILWHNNIITNNYKTNETRSITFASTDSITTNKRQRRTLVLSMRDGE